MATSGFAEYCFAQSDDGLTQYYLGRVTGGSYTRDENLQVRQGIGGQRDVVGGMVRPVLGFTLVPKTTTIFSYINRGSSGYPNVLPADVDLMVGDSNESVLYDDAYCNNCRFTLELEGDLELELEYWAASITAGAAATAPSESGATFVWYDSAVTIGGTGYQVQRAAITLSNNLKWVGSLDSKTASTRRFPDGIQAGDETVDIELTCLGDPSLSHYPDDPSTISNIQLVAGNGTNTVTIAVSTVYKAVWDVPFVASDDLVVRTLRAQAKPNGGVFSITVA